MKKTLSLVLALVLILSMVSFASAQEEKITISIMHYMGNTVKIDTFNKILEMYKETHPNIEFDAQMYSQNEYISNLPIRVANGDTPDIMMGSPKQYSDIIDAGKVMDLSDNELIAKLNLNEGDLNNCSYNGKVYALPMDFKTYGVMYNKAIFEKYGLQEPATLADLLAICDTLTANGVDPFIRNYSNVTYPDIEMRAILWPALVKNGHLDAFEKLMNGEAQFADYPEFAEAFANWKARLAYTRIDDMSNDTTMGRQLFAAGEGAMMYDGTWAYAQIQGFNPDQTYGMFAMPSEEGGNGWCIQLDQIFMVSNESAHTEAVMEFMAYLLSPETAGFWAANTLNPSVVPGVEMEMPGVVAAACKAKESGNVAHEGAFSTWLKSEYLTAWRQITQNFAADTSMSVDDAIQLLQDTYDEINASK